MTIYDVQNAQKTPIWKQRIIECRSSGMSVKEWCKERGLDFTTYARNAETKSLIAYIEKITIYFTLLTQ